MGGGCNIKRREGCSLKLLLTLPKGMVNAYVLISSRDSFLVLFRIVYVSSSR